jgi:hypothetical protein
MSAHPVQLPETGKILKLAIGAAALLAVTWLLSSSITANNLHGTLLIGAGLGVLAVAGKSLNDWRNGVYFFLIWLLFEDLIRKYMGNSMYVYFGKDALVAVTYAAFLNARWRGENAERFRPPFRYALGLFVLLGIAEVLNAGSPSLWYGVLGLKLYFYYVPLMFVGYALLRTERDLRRFLFVNAILGGLISLVGILQSIIGQDFLNPHSGADIEELAHEVRMTPSGLVVARPPSVFVSEGRSFDYLILAFTLILGAAAYLILRGKPGRKIVLPALALAAVAITLSGSRGDFVYFVASAFVLSAGMLWGAPRKLAEGYRLVKALRRTFIFVGAGLALCVVLFPSVLGARLAFYRETLSLNSPDSETAYRAWDYPLAAFHEALSDQNWLIGNGIGTRSLGGQYVSRIMQVPATGMGVESGYGVLVLETGVLGLVLWLAWTSSLIFSAFKVLLKVKGTWAFPVGLSIFWFAFYLLFPRTFGGMTAYQDFVLNAYLWLLVGMLFRLPGLVQESQQLTGDTAVNSSQLTVNSER